VRVARVEPGRIAPEGLVGAVLTRDMTVAGERWSKGRRLSAADLACLAAEPVEDPAAATLASAKAFRPRSGPVTVLVPEPGDVHEDEAALRLAEAVRGPGLEVRGPSESRVDLVATADGVVHVRVDAVDRIDRIDPLEIFTIFDGQVVSAGDLVASVKVAPHLVEESALAAGERLGARSGPVVRVAPFRPLRVGVLVKETVGEAARQRFEASVRAKVEGLGSRIVAVEYVRDEPEAVAAALGRMTRGRGGQRADVVLTAGGASTDPTDAFFVAVERLGGRVVRHGAPAHPGSMLWLARLGRTGILGMPTCGAYSKATAVDLVLPRLLTGEAVSRRTVARLGHGGILTRSQRFRFPRYARELDAPDG
jgi:molybdopterin biosynthesis enzyme